MLINWLMASIYELDKDLVLPRREAVYNNWIAARISPMLGGILYCNMDMSDPW